jgi:hypothetical protein
MPEVRDTVVLESSDLDPDGCFWKVLDIGDYRVWLQSGSHYEVGWEYGFQYRPRVGSHGPMKGPIFDQRPAELLGGFDAVMALALEAIRTDHIKSSATGAAKPRK